MFGSRELLSRGSKYRCILSCLYAQLGQALVSAGSNKHVWNGLNNSILSDQFGGEKSSKLLIKYSGPPLVESHHWNRKSHRRSSSVRVSEQSQQPCTRTTSLQFLHLLGNAVLALIDVRSSSRSRANARKISNRIGASLDDSSAAGTSGADQVQSTLCS